MAKRKKKWIQKAVKHPGALHEALGIPKDQKIPAEKLKAKPSDSPQMKRRKALARTLRSMPKKRAPARKRRR